MVSFPDEILGSNTAAILLESIVILPANWYGILYMASDRGPKISASEKKEIFDAFNQLETKILKIKKTVDTS